MFSTPLLRFNTKGPVFILKTIKNFSYGMSPKTALILLSDGSEEMEVVISVDILRRAGINVTVAGLHGDRTVECSRQVRISPDMSLKDAIAKSKFDVVVLPGGLKGSQEFCKSSMVGKLLKEQEESQRVIAAICAAPSALKAHNICLGKRITSYPSIQNSLTEGGQFVYSKDTVVIDGNLITSRGPGTAFDFALAIVEKMVGREAKETISKQMLL